MTELQLLWSFLQVGIFSVGGGYAALPLIERQVVALHPWLTMGEFADLVTIAEMTPGPLAINAATFVGIRIAGFPGALVATLGCILPSCVLVSLLAHVYNRYQGMGMMQSVLSALRPAVVALIAAAGLSVLGQVALQGRAPQWSNVNWIGVSLFSAALFALRKWKRNPIFVMFLCGIAGLGIELLLG